MDDILAFLNSPMVVGYLSATMRLAVPIMLAALGGVYNERSGVMNIGMEGMMLMGSLVGFVVGFMTNNIWLGILAAAVSGVLLGMILAFFTVTLSADQVVAGIAVNLLCVGLTSFLYRVFFGVDSQMAHITAAYTSPIPYLEKIPVLGPLFFQQSPLVYFTFVLIAISYVVITRTSWGLQIKAVGENPEAAETLGMNVQRTRYTTMIISGALSAIGGAFLSLVATHLFLDNMTAGRGYIALAIVVLGRRHPLGILLAALMFGGADALQLRTQTMDIGIPFQFMLMLPYVLTMVVLMIFVKKTDNPAALGLPYNPNRGESE
ncbi:MAG TPA: ABC transporter permease [Anaerolineaceae bacterium]|nr:ABC transporter permease [Anaerolineaceae bacterium]